MKQTAQNLKYKTQKYNTKNKLFFIVFGVIFFMLFCVITNRFFVIPVHAAINNQINFQGKLTNADGTNVADSIYTVIFSLYNVSSTGTALWTETDSVTTTNGIFQVPLGAVTSLPGNVDFNNNSIYLGIKVGTDAEMTPRIRFSAVPYAFNAAALDDVVATQSATGFSMQGGTSSVSSIAFTTTGGALTFQPGIAEGLTVQSNGANGLTLDTGGNGIVNVGNTNATSIVFGNAAHNPTLSLNGTGLTTLGGGLTVDGSTISLSNASSSTIQTTGVNSGLTLLSNGSGNITLGQNAGNGNIVIQPNAGGQAGLIINDGGSGDLFTASAGGTTKFRVLNNGDLQLNNYTANGGLLFTSGTGVVAQTAAGTSVQCLLGGATPIFGTCALGTNEWQEINGAISPTTITDDMLLGGTSTSSARFAFINDIGAGTPTASVSAGIAGATYFNATGTIQTTANQSLIIGGATTGNLILNPMSGNYIGVGTVNPLATLDVRSATSLNGGTIATASISGKTSFAGLVVNNFGTGDLFTASSAGATKFIIKNSGSVVFGGNDTTISASGSGATNNGSGAVENDLGDEGSLVPNAGFEASNNLGGFADSWVAAASTSATVTRDVSTEAKGNASAKVVTSATNQLVAFYSACMPLSLSVGALGGNYNLNYYLKYASVTKLATVRAYIDGYTSETNCNSNTTPTTSAPVNTTNLTTASWQLVSGTSTIPLFGAALTWGRVHFFVTNNTTAAQVNIDGVRLIETTNGSGLDYAEDYPADPNNIPQPGQVVSLEDSGTDSQVSPSSVYMDQSSIGVVSTNPGDVLDDGSMTNPVPVALAGRVPVNVSTANGPIQVGDYLTSSTTPGVAVKAISAGPVIGTAMEGDSDTNATDVNQVTMFIKNTYYNGGTESLISGLDLLSNEQDASVILQLLQGTQSTSSSVALSDIANGNGTDGLSLLLSAISGHTASGSASQIATSSANFQNNQLTINGLTVSGSATVSADLHVKGNGLVEGILHIADTLFANNFIVNGISDFFGNVIFHSGVTFTNAPVFDKDTAGFAVISKGSDHVDVTFSAPYDQTPIINASITLNPITPKPNESLDQQQTRESQLETAILGNIHYIIINRTTKGFTILLDQPSAEDISFSWVALAVNSPVIFQSNGQNLQIPTPTEDVSPSPMDTIIPSGIPVSPILTPTGDDTPTPGAGG